MTKREQKIIEAADAYREAEKRLQKAASARMRVNADLLQANDERLTAIGRLLERAREEG